MTDIGMERYEALEDVPPDARAQALADADAVYGYLRRAEGQLAAPIGEESLRKWGEQNDIGPDRMNPALKLLGEEGRVHAFD